MTSILQDTGLFKDTLPIPASLSDEGIPCAAAFNAGTPGGVSVYLFIKRCTQWQI